MHSLDSMPSQTHPNGPVEGVPQPALHLSQVINASTRDGHDVVNRLIMSRLRLGLQDHRLYREGILSFAFIYKAFEEAWVAAIEPSAPTDPRVKSALQGLYSTSLLRTPQLIKDLDYFFGSVPYLLGGPRTFQRSTYVAHIRRVISEKPHLVIAYAHNYYMALFAGGRVLKYHISQAQNFFPKRGQMTAEECRQAGTNLFSFEVEKGKEEMLRVSFKAALVDLEGSLTAEEKNDIVEESKAIFRNNELIIYELDQICAHLAVGYSTLDPAPWSTQEFIYRYRFPLLFFVLFFFAVIKLCFF